MSEDSSILLSSKKSAMPKRGILKVILQFTTSYDILILGIGLLAVTIFSLCPIMMVIQAGKAFKSIEENPTDSNKFFEEQRELGIVNFVLAGAAILTGWISVICFVKFGCRQGLFWKKAYFKAITSLLNGLIKTILQGSDHP